MAGPIIIEGPDGQEFEFPEGTSDDVISITIRRAYAGQPQAAAPAPAQTQPRNMREGFEIVERFPNNVFLMREPDGTQSLVTPGFATSDKKDIDAILRPYRKATEYRERVKALEEREKTMARQPVPGEERLRAGATSTTLLQMEALEKKALEQERIFERLAGGNVKQVLGRELSRKKPVSMMALQFLKGIPIVGQQVAGALTEAATAGTPGAEAMTQMGIQPREVTAAAMAETERTQPISSGTAGVAGAVTSTAAVPGLLPLLTPRGATAGAQMASGAFRGTTAAAIEGAGTAALEAPEGQRMGAALEGGVRAAPFGFLGGLVPPVSTEMVVNAKRYIGRVDDNRLARDLGVTPETASVFRDRMMNEDFQGAMRALDKAGANAMLADASGDLRTILNASIKLGGAGASQARTSINARASAASERFKRYMDNVLGVPEGRESVGARIRKATEEERDAVYTAAYARPIDYSAPSGKTVENLLDRIPPGAIQQANELMRLDGLKSQQILANVAEDGTISFRSLPDVRQVDYIRRALGDIVKAEKGKGAMGGLTDYGSKVNNLRRELRDAVSESVPEYRTALDTAASTIDQINAADVGYEALKSSMRPEIVRRELDNMTKAEQAAAKIGLRNAIEDEMSTVSKLASDPEIEPRELRRAMGLMTSRSFEQKLDIIMGQREAAEFRRVMDEELTSLYLRAAVARNSDTSTVQGFQQAVEARVKPGILKTLAAEPLRGQKSLVTALMGTTDDALQARRMGVYDEIALYLVNQRGQQAKDAMKLLEKAVKGEELSRTQANIIAAAVFRPAALAGATAGIQEYRYNPETDDFE